MEWKEDDFDDLFHKAKKKDKNKKKAEKNKGEKFHEQKAKEIEQRYQARK